MIDLEPLVAATEDLRYTHCLIGSDYHLKVFGRQPSFGQRELELKRSRIDET